MINMGLPHEADRRNEQAWVFDFPMKSPKGALTRTDLSAIEQLEIWKKYQLYWCEHKPSCTVYVKDDEWMEVGAWVYKNFDLVSGLSFFPYSEHTYPQAPYEEITKEAYKEMVKEFPKDLDWSRLSEFEKEDQTTGSQELACIGGVCEI